MKMRSKSGVKWELIDFEGGRHPTVAARAKVMDQSLGAELMNAKERGYWIQGAELSDPRSGVIGSKERSYWIQGAELSDPRSGVIGSKELKVDHRETLHGIPAT
jgi:hypothetical protein